LSSSGVGPRLCIAPQGAPRPREGTIPPVP
jgi:hypothetical protein